MPPIPHRVTVKDHPGSSLQDVNDEPEWGFGHEHRIGFRNAQDRVPGLTHSGDDRGEDSEPSEDIESKKAAEKYYEFQEEVREGKLVNFRDVINAQEDFHLRRPDVHSEGWRFVLNATESWIKNEEAWPANVEKKQKDEEANKKKEGEEKKMESGDIAGKRSKDGKGEQVQQEHEWKRENGDNKHHDAYAGGSDADAEDSSGDEHEKSEDEKLREKYSPQEIALLRSLRHEKEYICNLSQNDGKRKSPVTHANPLVSIDEADQFSPDNWIPRSSNIIRLTGKVCR
jgi:nitrate reductase (NAD(P)H)